MSNKNSQTYSLFKWPNAHFFAFAIYLSFVWGLAYIKHDYLWIVGDDPNLLEQSLLITKGFVPNIDFFSGYPGLSLQLHAVIIKLFGVQPLTQHIYSAFLATMLGIALFWAAKSIKPWLVLLFLIFTYSQGQLLNPTPNPGFLFETAFIVGLKKTLDFFKSQNSTDALLAGVFFAISFLAKQYGIFGPVCFFIASVALLNVQPLKQKVMFGVALSITSGSILYVYFANLIPNIDQYNLLVRNTSLFLMPVFAGLISVLALKSNPSEKLIPLSMALRANLIVTGVFACLVMLYLLTIYGANHIFDVLREIMVMVPRKINGYLVPVIFSHDSVVGIIYALLILFLPLMADHYLDGKHSSIIFATAGMSSGFLLFRSGALSSTPFISIAFVILVVAAFFLLKDGNRRRLLAMLAGFSPCFLILVPYPNYAYHIPIVVFFVLYCYAPAKLQVAGRPWRFLSFYGLLPYGMIAFVSWNAIFNASKEMSNYKIYTFKNIEFRSGDNRWGDAIEEARHVENGTGECATYACRYLLLTMPKFNNYSNVIEKPIGAQLRLHER